MRRPNCLVFPDGQDWIVFAPLSRLLMRTNATVADRFRNFVDTGERPGKSAPLPTVSETHEFAPNYVTISCTNRCANRCVYCYGTPAHRNASHLNIDFCHEALQLVGQQAKEHQHAVHVSFHGVGEPTLVWPLFTKCVEMVRRTQEQYEIRVHITLCTSGQVSEEKARWIILQLDEVHVSLDGPSDIQNAQRPRADGRDSLEGPLRLARAVREAGKPIRVKTTVTSLSVGRMVEIVEFVASELGRVRLDFGAMFAPVWVDTRLIRPPQPEEFAAQFGRALDRGRKLGVQVRHPEVAPSTLAQSHPSIVSSHFCLAPPNIITAFYDVPNEGSGNPELGAYGWYDSATKSLRFDHEKRRELERQQASEECLGCPCSVNCLGPGGVKGRMPGKPGVAEPDCRARVGVLRELLRRAVPRRMQTTEKHYA
jgi:sulfatase maturation enzyme AslB (radical SAM superfamily)